jgi:hypothetical protein
MLSFPIYHICNNFAAVIELLETFTSLLSSFEEGVEELSINSISVTS